METQLLLFVNQSPICVFSVAGQRPPKNEHTAFLTYLLKIQSCFEPLYSHLAYGDLNCVGSNPGIYVFPSGQEHLPNSSPSKHISNQLLDFTVTFSSRPDPWIKFKNGNEQNKASEQCTH